MKADLRRLQDRVEGLAAGQEELHRRIEALQASSAQRQQGLNASIAEISRGLQDSAAAREQLKREVVDGLSKKMSALMRAQAMPAPGAARGYEHVVEDGQTLSEIAAVYRVTTRAIVEANGLTNPDQIRAGQKLFIPE
jgi:LysM repeat protein